MMKTITCSTPWYFGIRSAITRGANTEITAVCVHPSHRGHGYGQILLSAISRQIVARDEIPFLHVFTSNASAIALYRRRGMEIRRRLHVTVLQKQV